MRAGRSTSGTSYSYVYNGSQLTQMTVGGNTLQFRYSATGAPMAVIYNGTYYYYVTNIQGDILAILNSSGGEVVTYAYDAWGNILTTGGSMASTLGAHNPLRYRGYVYDQEIGLYYLQSRYYNPEIGRFISADDVSYLGADGSILSYNLFAYCGNMPVMCKQVSMSDNNLFNDSSLPNLPWLVNNATTVYSTYATLSAAVPVATFFFKNLGIIADEYSLYGISPWKSATLLAGVNWKLTRTDGVMMAFDVALDIYDSIQRGVSTEGVILGAALTLAKDVALLYANKGIMYGATAIGTAICPGIGTAVGFVVGIGVCLIVDWKVGELISEWIDSIAA